MKLALQLRARITALMYHISLDLPSLVCNFVLLKTICDLLFSEEVVLENETLLIVFLYTVLVEDFLQRKEQIKSVKIPSFLPNQSLDNFTPISIFQQVFHFCYTNCKDFIKKESSSLSLI